MALNIDTIIPIISVSANPFTMPVPNHIRIRAVIIEEIFESRIELQAREKPSLRAVLICLPARCSSFILSKIKILASTAAPIDNIKPAIPERVSVTGINLKIAITIEVYNSKAIEAKIPL